MGVPALLQQILVILVKTLSVVQLSGVEEVDSGLSGFRAVADSLPLGTTWVDDGGFRQGFTHLAGIQQMPLSVSKHR